MVMTISTEYTYSMYIGILCQTVYREGKVGGNTIIVNITLPSVISLIELLQFLY